MADLILDYLLLSEGQILAVNYGFIVLGGVLGGMFLNIRFRLRRVMYFLSLASLNVVLLLASMTVWGMLPLAADAGFLVPVGLLGFGVLVASGTVLYVISAARANDISGTSFEAFMGFIPVANLYLLFAPGQLRVRHFAARWLLDPALVIAGLLVFSAVNTVVKMDNQRGKFSGTTTSDTLTEILADAMPVADFLAQASAEMKDALPLQVDETTRLVSLKAEGHRLTYTYKVAADIDQFHDGFEKGLAESNCRPDLLGPSLSKGAEIIHRYEREDGYVIGNFEITYTDCSN